MQDLSLYFRALSDRKRLGMVLFLAQHGEATVTELVSEMRLSQPLISWHLRILRRAGVVKTRKDGRQVLCSLNRSGLRQYQQRIDEAFGLGENTLTEETDAALPIGLVRQG